MDTPAPPVPVAAPVAAPIAPVATATAASSGNGPLGHETWQWIVIIGTTGFFMISLYSMYKQLQVSKLQIAQLEKAKAKDQD
jgi:hypothetical protein